MKKSATYLTFILLIQSISGNFGHLLIPNINPSPSQNFATYVCESVDKELRKEPNIRRVAIVKDTSSFDEDFIDEISTCISIENSLLIMDLNGKNLPNLNDQKPSLFVLLAEEILEVNLALI